MMKLNCCCAVRCAGDILEVTVVGLGKRMQRREILLPTLDEGRQLAAECSGTTAASARRSTRHRKTRHEYCPRQT